MKETIIVALKLHIKNKIEMSVQNQKTILKYINEQDKEIERLNNIINELEKWAKEELEHPNWASCGARCMLDKLQELKGDSSNE